MFRRVKQINRPKLFNIVNIFSFAYVMADNIHIHPEAGERQGTNPQEAVSVTTGD